MPGFRSLEWIGFRLVLVAALGALGCSPRATDAGAERAAPVAPSNATHGLPVVRSLALTVSDLDRSIETFRALDFRLENESYARGSAFAAWAGIEGAEMRSARLELGAEEVELRQFVTPVGRPIATDTQSNDQIFQHMAIVVRDMDQAFARLRAVPGIELVSEEPQTIPRSNPAAGGVRALYFKDSDRHNLELLWFPEGKGQKRWHTPGIGLFLGIDHSAIAVSDTARSQSFYEALGFVVAGRSLNSGVEQAALSGVAGARVQITGLAPDSGPGLEFLSYLEPGPGRAIPGDTAVNDLWHWEVNTEVADLGAALEVVAAEGGRARPISDVSSFEPNYRFASLVQDRDGHSLQLLQR